MTVIAAKQISRLIGSYVKVPNVITVGSSINITSPLTTALLTARIVLRVDFKRE